MGYKGDIKMARGVFFVFSIFLAFLAADVLCAKEQNIETIINVEYIVIHHSATRRGNMKMFDRYHKGRGMKNGVAYHFVIDNGTCGKSDGQLEISPRWKKRVAAGGCRQDYYNQNGVHICLVGNFTKNPPTRRQMRTLVNLADELRKKYNIQMKNIAGHGKLKGEKTQCPGKKFPWDDFYASLKKQEEEK